MANERRQPRQGGLVRKNPLSVPDIPDELRALARALDQKVIRISLAEHPTADDPELKGLTFLALADFIPRPGESIQTQNGQICTVKNVLHTVRPVAPKGEAEAFILIPLVLAVHNAEKETT